jgi:mono/diheme cytochrome c family protein
MNACVRRSCGLLAALCISALLIGAAATTQSSDDWKAPARAARKKNPLKNDDETIAVGKDLYAHNCATCHGAGGRGDGPAAKDLNPRPRDLTSERVTAQSDGALFWKIGEGHRPMPRFEQLLTDDSRWHVVTYVRTLAPKKPPATQPGPTS